MPAKGGHQPESAREAIRAAHKGREFSPEHRANLAASLRGKKHGPRSEETKKRIKAALIGRKKTPEQIEKNRVSHLGQPSARKGVTLSDHTKEKIRQARAIQGNPKMNLRGITQAQMDEATASGLRWCAGQCKAFIPIDRFYKGGESKRTICAACGLLVNRQGRDAMLRRQYGITAEWYNETLARQNGHCALCPRTVQPLDMTEASDRSKRRYLAVDHDHETGKVRGLLCHKCNISIYSVEYVSQWARRAVEYLLHHGSEIGKHRIPEHLPSVVA